RIHPALTSCPYTTLFRSELVSKHQLDGCLRFTGDYAQISDNDYVFIAVPTPSQENGSADTSYVLQAVDSLIPYAKRGLLIVIKSTVPVGTADYVAVMASVMEAGVEVVSNPEFLRQGTAVSDFLQPVLAVMGSSALRAAVDITQLYASLDAP